MPSRANSPHQSLYCTWQYVWEFRVGSCQDGPALLNFVFTTVGICSIQLIAITTCFSILGSVSLFATQRQSICVLLSLRGSPITFAGAGVAVRVGMRPTSTVRTILVLRRKIMTPSTTTTSNTRVQCNPRIAHRLPVGPCKTPQLWTHPLWPGRGQRCLAPAHGASGGSAHGARGVWISSETTLHARPSKSPGKAERGKR